MEYEKNYKLGNENINIFGNDENIYIRIDNFAPQVIRDIDSVYSKKDNRFYLPGHENYEEIYNNFCKDFDLCPSIYCLDNIERFDLYLIRHNQYIFCSPECFSVYRITDTKEDFAFGFGIPWNIVRGEDNARYFCSGQISHIQFENVMPTILNEEHKIADNKYVLGNICNFEHTGAIYDYFTSTRIVVNWNTITLDKNMLYTVDTYPWILSNTMKKYLHNYIQKYILGE